MGRQNQKPFLCFLVVLLGVALHIFVGLAWTPSAFAQSSREQALELAKEALVLEKQLSADSLQLRLLEPAEWPDASLGCPVTGRIYAQVTTSGYRVVLSAGASVFRVHVGGGSAVICGERLSVAQPRSSFAEEPELPIAEPTEPALKRLVTQARQDLAERLGIEAEDIELLELQELVWPDTSLGCSAARHGVLAGTPRRGPASPSRGETCLRLSQRRGEVSVSLRKPAQDKAAIARRRHELGAIAAACPSCGARFKLRSSDDLRDQRPRDVGEAHVAAVEPVGELRVVHPQQVQYGRV